MISWAQIAYGAVLSGLLAGGVRCPTGAAPSFRLLMAAMTVVSLRMTSQRGVLDPSAAIAVSPQQVVRGDEAGMKHTNPGRNFIQASSVRGTLRRLVEEVG
jgi:hypothetical protein